MCHWAEIKHVCVKGKIMYATCCEGENFARLFCMFYLSSFFFFFGEVCNSCWTLFVDSFQRKYMIPANFSFIVKQPNVFAKMFYFYLQFNTRLIFRIIVIKWWFLNLWNFTPLFLMEGNFSHSSKSYLSFHNVVVYFDNHFVKIYTCNCFIPDQQ